ncbi:MAG TPA: acetate--CoA ligase family protein [Solirubrobacteraceae bacterium]|nr:acetate--CoA ligase family protein [Solirubrobacteraceae bacterium]
MTELGSLAADPAPEARNQPWSLVDAAAAAELACEYGIPIPRQEIVSRPEDAVRAAAEIGYPVALKAVRADIVHKTELGAVALDLRDSEAVHAAATEMSASFEGETDLLVQRMARGDIEMIVGTKRDPTFGPVVLVGLGGVWAEVLNDVIVRLAPVSAAEAEEMLGELRGAALLHGDRGQPAADLYSLSQTIVAASRLAADHPEVLELDLNPLICRTDGVTAVDVRIIRSEPASLVARASGAPAHLDRLFEPRSLAVIGASRDARKQGGRLLHYLVKHGYQGELFAVNPNATEIVGCMTVPSIEALPVVPDLVCIALPSGGVVPALEAAGKLGVRMAIVFTAGFSEVGAAGDQLQQEILEVAARYGMRLCGPNTAGVVSLPGHMCATMGMAFEADEVPAGAVALLTQSGAIGGALLSRLWDTGAGFSRWVSVGNEADLGLGDYLNWLADDPATELIAMFIESVRDVPRFREACERARARGKPVLAYKTGSSEAGRRAVQSHTAALAGDHVVYTAALRSLGVIQVDDLQTLIDVAVLLSWQPAPRGGRIGIVSASGGACSVAADECKRHGLEVPQLSPEARARVAELVPDFAATDNPVDVTMEVTVRPEMVGHVTQVLLEQDEIDAVLVMMTTNADPPAVRVAETVIEAASTRAKTVVVARMGADFLAPESLRRYRRARIPVLPMPDRAVRALAAAVGHGRSGERRGG